MFRLGAHMNSDPFVMTPEQENLMNLLYNEVEIAIQEGNPPFTAIITDSANIF